MSHQQLTSACQNGDRAAAEAVLAPLSEQQQRDLVQQSDEAQNNTTPLHWACGNGHLAVAEMLIGKGADVEAKNKWNWTPLHWACMKGHLAVAEMLIGKGADMEAKNWANYTALHWACENGHLAVAEMLIGKGADMEAKNDDGKTPLDVCKSDDMRRRLKQAAANVQTRAASAPAAHGARAVRSSARPSGASGHTAASPKSRAAPVPAPARQSAPEHRPAPAAVNNGPDIFISLRFGEALPAAEALKAKLEAKGVSVFLCAVAAGGNLYREIASNIDACRLVVILGTKTYGKDTGIGFCTANELEFIISENKEIFLVKMCDRFDEPTTRMTLGRHIMHHPWMPATEAEQRQVPDVIVDEIIDKLHNL